jgi:hypothetical protein
VQDHISFRSANIGSKNYKSGTPFLCLSGGQREFLERTNYWRVIAKMKYVHFQGNREARTGCASAVILVRCKVPAFWFGAKRRSFYSARSAGVCIGAKRLRSARRDAPALNVVQEATSIAGNKISRFVYKYAKIRANAATSAHR